MSDGIVVTVVFEVFLQDGFVIGLPRRDYNWLYEDVLSHTSVT
jgi:hypothetical protein